jgi:hypothetical protein
MKGVNMSEFQEYPKMLYKCPGQTIHNDGITFDYFVAVDAASEELATADGWRTVLEDAWQASQKPVVDDPRADLEKQAAELGIVVDKRWNNASLRQRIDDVLAK